VALGLTEAAEQVKVGEPLEKKGHDNIPLEQEFVWNNLQPDSDSTVVSGVGIEVGMLLMRPKRFRDGMGYR